MAKLSVKNILGCLLVFSMNCALSHSAQAQSIWTQQVEPPSIGLEILKANFDDFNDVAFSTSLIYITTQIPFSEQFVFVGELPISHADFTFQSFNFSETSVGNPYVGVKLMLENSPASFEFGLRPNVTPDDKPAAATTAFNTDVDRFEAFIPKLVTFLGRVHYKQQTGGNFVVRLDGGPTLWVFTDNGIDNKTQFWVNYSGMVGYDGQFFNLFGGITGRVRMSQSGSFGERSTHQLGVTAGLNLGHVKPGLHFRVPIDNQLNNVINYVIGLNLNVELY